MRRLLLIFLMLLVPTQATWSAGHALYGHLDGKVASVDLHNHAHDHDHESTGHHDVHASDSGADLGAGTPTHGDDGDHGSHVHPAFTMILPDRIAGSSYAARALPSLSFSTAFTSYIPPLFDRPPTARI